MIRVMSFVSLYQRNLSHVANSRIQKKYFYSSPYWTTAYCVQFCARHVVQGLTRICISARFACYYQEGAKHKTEKRKIKSLRNKLILCKLSVSCFQFGFLYFIPLKK